MGAKLNIYLLLYVTLVTRIGCSVLKTVHDINALRKCIHVHVFHESTVHLRFKFKKTTQLGVAFRHTQPDEGEGRWPL